jgi:uncharacterized protein (DUF58 family)
VLTVGIVAWLIAWRLGWTEPAVIAGACLLLLAIASLFLVGRTSLAVRLVVEPPRVTVGEPVTGSLDVVNRASSPLLPLTLEVPVGRGGVAFQVPMLRPGGEHGELFVVPTERRGVIAVGPVTSVRADPIGLLRRDVIWSQATEIFVHPRVVPLEPLGAGLIRDLEGNTAENVSMSDLAFHALREYTPGDDLRHIHWRSSARHGTLLVRQFLDTRRSHLTMVVDCELPSYRSEDDYETAMSVAGSLLVRAALDQYDATFVSGSSAASRASGKAVLDACSRAEPGTRPIVEVAGEAARLAPDTSVVFLVTGPHPDYRTLQRAARQFSVDVGAVAVVVDGTASASLRTVGDISTLTLGRLEELPALLRWGI